MNPEHHAQAFSHMIKLTGTVLTVLLLLGVAAVLGFGWYQTRKVEAQANNELFRSGKVPTEAPDGFLKGSSFTGLGKNWQGKVFNKEDNSGTNKFNDGERFAFKTYPADGIRDKDIKVLRIDYNQPNNPIWLKFIVDEVVEVEPDKYLGKVHLKLLPGLVFTLTYFELHK